MKALHRSQIAAIPFILVTALILSSCTSIGHSEETPAKAEKSVMFNLGTYVVNLDLKSNKVLKLSLNAELGSPLLVDVAGRMKTALRDKILTVVSGHSYENLMTTEGRTTLKRELQAQLNGTLGDDGIKELYITEFIIM